VVEKVPELGLEIYFVRYPDTVGTEQNRRLHFTMPTSRLAATTTVFACTISGGLLTLPSVFASTSLGVSLLVVLFSAITTFSSLLTLVVLGEIKDSWSYGELVGAVFGKRSELLINLIIGFFLVGVIGGSFIVINDYTTQSFTGWHSSALTIGTAVLVALLSLPPKMSALSVAATFSMCSFLFLVVTFIYYGTVEISGGGHYENKTNSTPWWPSKSSDFESRIATIGTAVPVILYAFGCQIQIFSIYESVGQKKMPGGVRHFVPVLVGAVALMVVLFSLVGVFGYYTFEGSQIDGDVLKSLMTKGTLGNVARGMLVLACLLAAPLIVNPTLACFAPTFNSIYAAAATPSASTSSTSSSASSASSSSSSVRRWERPLLVFIVVGLAVTLALSGINFLVVVGALGAFICSPLFFILPGGMLLHAMKFGCYNDGQQASSASTLNQMLLVKEEEEGGEDEDEEDDSVGNLRVLLLSRRERCGAIAMGLWLFIMGVLTFVLAVWKFFKK